MTYSFAHDPEVDHAIVMDGMSFERWVRELSDQKCISWDVEADGLDPFRGRRIIGHAFAWRLPSGKLRSFYAPIRHASLFGLFGNKLDQLDPALVSRALKPVLENQQVLKAGHNLQADVMLALPDDLNVCGPVHDTMTACKLADENRRSYKLPDCLRDFGILHDPTWKASITPDLQSASKQLYGFKGVDRVRQEHGYKYVDIPRLGPYACQDAVYEHRLYEAQVPLNNRWRNIWDMEMELFWCAVDMRKVGVPVVPSVLRELSVQQQARMDELAPLIWQAAGEEFELGNDTQLRRILFEKMGYPSHAQTKGKWVDGENVDALDKVDDDALWWLETQHGSKLAGWQREWNKAEKVVSTYTKPLVELADEWGVLHTEFDPAGAKTGRFSCLAGHTLIQTRDHGLVRMDVVRPGMHVWTHKGRWRAVTDHWSVGVQPVVDLHLSSGDVLTCTTSHGVLLQGGQWETVERIRNEHFSGMDPEAGQRGSSAGVVSRSTLVDAAGDCGRDGEHVSQRAARGEDPHAAARKESARISAEVGLQGRIEKPNEREGAGGASQLAGGSSRRIWLPDDSVRREASVRPSRGDDASLGAASVTEAVGCPSHRRGSVEQPAGQSCTCDARRAQAIALHAVEGHAGYFIEKINDGGSAAVYDISVEEDESYASLGLFSHNCKSPNLQNVPVRTELGRTIRTAFVARPGMVRFCLDYSQIELRVLAHLSQDPLLLKVYREGGDVHRQTAVTVFGTDQKVNGIDMRRLAKIVNFGIPFGITEIGVMRNLNKDLPPGQKPIDDESAGKALVDWYSKYRGVDAYRRSLWYQFERNDGLGWNMFGRPRRVPDILSDRKGARSRAERQITSSLVQGSAADLIKKSMLNAWKYVKAQSNCEAYMVLMVHDDLQFDMSYAGSAATVREVKRIMEVTCQPQMSVPVIVDCEYFTDNWANKKDMEGF